MRPPAKRFIRPPAEALPSLPSVKNHLRNHRYNLGIWEFRPRITQTKRLPMKRIYRIGVAVLLNLCCLSASMAATRDTNQEGAIHLIRDSIRHMQADLAARDTLADVHKLVEQVVPPLFDRERMSKYVLGEQWLRLGPEQQRLFMDEFMELLLNAYTEMVFSYRGDEVELLPLAADPNSTRRAVVSMRLNRSVGTPILFQYKMIQSEGVWKMYDVVTDGVSLIANYRSWFGRKLAQEGFEALLGHMKEHNERQAQRLRGQ